MSERGEYRSITKVLLDGPDFQELPERANHLFLVLKINFGPSGIDVWYPDELVSRLSRQTRIPPDAVRVNLDILEHANWIRREGNIVWIVEQLAHDPHTKRANVNHRAGVHRHLAGLPHLELVREFVRHYKDWFEAKDTIPDGLLWALASHPKPRKRDRKPIGNPSESHEDGMGDTIPISKSKSESNPESESEIAGAPAPDSNGGNWVAAATDLWRSRVGDVEGGHIAGTLKGAVAQHGWPVIRKALEEYVTSSVKTKVPKYFAADVIRWIAESNEPLQDQFGCPTAKADRLVRATA